jgi:hypothetical protein
VADIPEDVKELNELFNTLCGRFAEDSTQAFDFIEVDMVRLLCEELVALAVYARMEFIKLMLLQAAADEALDTPTMGTEAFRATGDTWKGKPK